MEQHNITTKNLRKNFGKKTVLDNVSLQINAGSVYGLVGLNGAGKTTFIKILLGLLRADGGDVVVAGFDPWKHESEFYKSLGVTLESDGFAGNLTVRENLYIYADAKNISRADVDKYFDEHWGGTDIYKTSLQVKKLSRGQRTQCGLARAFLGNPKVYIFDEPIVNLDFLAYEHFCGMVRNAQKNGAAFLISSHQLEVVDDLCDRVGFLRDGRLEEITRDDNDNDREQKFSDVIKSIYRGYYK